MDCPNRLRKHIAGIVKSLRKSSERKRLTRRSTGDKINLSNGFEVKLSHIGFMHKRRIEILAKTCTSPLIGFNKTAVLKSGQFQPFCQSTATTEEF